MHALPAKTTFPIDVPDALSLTQPAFASVVRTEDEQEQTLDVERFAFVLLGFKSSNRYLRNLLTCLTCPPLLHIPATLVPRLHIVDLVNLSISSPTPDSRSENAAAQLHLHRSLVLRFILLGQPRVGDLGCIQFSEVGQTSELLLQSYTVRHR